jgi:hypothetical protein
MATIFEGFAPEVPRTWVYIHQMPFPKLLTTNEALCNLIGILYTGPDRRFDYHDEIGMRSLWSAWQKDIQKAEAMGSKYKVPDVAMDYFQKTKHLSRPPRCSDTNIQQTGPIDELLVVDIEAFVKKHAENSVPAVILEEKIQSVPVVPGFKPPKFSWSYTSLVNFETCPLSFAEQRYYKTIKFMETPEIKDGNVVHIGLENYLKSKVRIDRITDYTKFADAIIAASEGGELLIEQELCINEGMQMTGWFAPDAWGRAKLDVAIIKDGVAKIYDWKTGKEKKDDDQLEIFCIFLALARRDVHTFISRYIWLKNGNVSAPITLTRADLLPAIKTLLGRIARCREAWDHQLWMAKTSGLCKKYCDVMTCVHNGKREC